MVRNNLRVKSLLLKKNRYTIKQDSLNSMYLQDHTSNLSDSLTTSQTKWKSCSFDETLSEEL